MEKIPGLALVGPPLGQRGGSSLPVLASLLRSLDVTSILGDPSVVIHGLSQNHHQVESGHLYFAIKGYQFDGDDFVAQAFSRGARAVISSTRHHPPPGACSVRVSDARQAMAHLAAEFYDHPSRQLRLIGVTGTNGKTTTTFYLKNILEAAGLRTAVLGTVGYSLPGVTLPAVRTTPGPLELQRYFQQMVRAQTDYCLMEVSAHALTTQRVGHCQFAAGVFTNFSPEHLNFYPSLEAYLEAKASLFAQLGQTNTSPHRCYAVVNGDDAAHRHVLRECSQPVLRFGQAPWADLVLEECRPGGYGYHCRARSPLHTVEFSTQLPGRFNVDNALAALGVAQEEGIPREFIRAGIEQTRAVPGRYHALLSPQGYTVWVDFAHNPRALHSILQAGRQHFPHSRLILVTGCEGGTDAAKRYQTGLTARRADYTILTSDNVYHDDAEQILRDLARGLEAAGRCRGRDYQVEAHRFLAIRTALQLACPGDLVIVAGKGHEECWVVGDEKIPFNDAQVVQELFRSSPTLAPASGWSQS